MKLDKTFLARLLGVDESEIMNLSGMTFELANSPEGLDFKGLINERHQKRFKALSEILTKDDDLGRVVRAHIYIEHELQDFIFFAAPCPDHLQRLDDIEFCEKVRLALVLGLDPALKPALNAIGRLRNKFAHTLDMKISEDEVKNLIDWRDTVAFALPKVSIASILTTKKHSPFRANTRLFQFFLTLFDEVGRERFRQASEKLRDVASWSRSIAAQCR